MLPPEVLDLVVSEVRGKNLLRSTCRGLRLAVDTCTSKLTWSRPSDHVAAAPRRSVTLGLALPAAPMLALKVLEFSDVHSLEGCPDMRERTGDRPGPPGSVHDIAGP